MAKILVVEDDEDIRRLLVKRVEAGGHKVLAVGSAAEALSMVKEKGAPEIVLLDVGLPDMEGTDLLVLLRDELGRPDLPAIFLSARVNPEDIELGRSLGAKYLTKPVVITALLNAITAALVVEKSGW